MNKTADNDRSGSYRRGILILLCALTPILAGLLVPDGEPEPGTPAPSQSTSETRASDPTGRPDPAAQPASGVDLARFDARERARQRDALRELEATNPQPVWSLLLKRHADGDKAAFNEFLAGITPGNAMAAWEVTRGAKLSREERAAFYQTLGRVGGGDVVKQLIDLTDRDAALAVRGWADADSAAALDWYRALDVDRDPRMQQYLADGNLLTEGFLDQVSASLLDSMNPAPAAADSGSSGGAFADEATRLVESLMGENPRKGEAMMRELTERFIDLYDSDAVADWFNQLDNPDVQSAAIQRIIEGGVFKDDPFQAVDVALSLDDPKSRGNAISAAYGQLGSGAGGVDPGSIAGGVKVFL